MLVKRSLVFFALRNRLTTTTSSSLRTSPPLLEGTNSCLLHYRLHPYSRMEHTQRYVSSIDHHVEAITQSLQALGQPSKKEWWERYLKGEIEFYGVPMADIRSSIKTWIDSSSKGSNSSPAILKETAWALFEKPIAEQKLAAILLFQNHVEMNLQDLDKLVSMFQEGHIRDWNTTDWLCVRVLGPLVEREGDSAITVLKQWVDDPTNVLWQKRAALVAFVNITKENADHILEIASSLAQDEERFAQTAIGWTLRNLSQSHPDKVVEFVKGHKEALSSEALNMACAKLSDKNRKKAGITGKRKRR